jgi:hypothetical protein
VDGRQCRVCSSTAIRTCHTPSLPDSRYRLPTTSTHRRYDEFAAALGRDPAGTKVALLGDYTNVSYARPFFDIVMRPLDELGVTAHWQDWQAVRGVPEQWVVTWLILL